MLNTNLSLSIDDLKQYTIKYKIKTRIIRFFDEVVDSYICLK